MDKTRLNGEAAILTAAGATDYRIVQHNLDQQQQVTVTLVLEVVDLVLELRAEVKL